MRHAAPILAAALLAAACGGQEETATGKKSGPISLGAPEGDPHAGGGQGGAPPGHPPMSNPHPAAEAPAPVPAGNVKVDRFRAPEGWQAESPSSGMRLLQFRLPRADGDARDGEAVVFTNIGGSPQSNVDRWRGQFQEVAKDRDAVTEVTEGVKGKVTFLDITGKYGGGMGGTADPHAGSGGSVETRMIGAVVESADGVYYVKVTGPPPTIGKWEKSIRDFVLESARK